MAKLGKIPIALAALLALLLLAGRLHPAILDGIVNPSGMLTSCSSLTENQSLMRVLEWTGLSLIAIMVGLVWAIIGQILGGTFGGQKYNEFVKGMIWGGVETAALLGLFTALFSAFWGYGMDNIVSAQAYAALARNTVSFDFGLMLGANFIAGFITNMNPQFKIPGPAYMTVSFQIAPMFKPILDILGTTMQLITTALVMWAAQEFLLCFIKGNMLVILIPAGFFLRGFGLKAGGNALLGIALSLFFIYPYMINLTGQVVTSQIEDDILSSRATYSDPATSNRFPDHPWANTCVMKPICCLQNSQPDSPDDLYIKNGGDGSWPLYRVSPQKVSQGLFSMRYDDATGGSHVNYCMYNTLLSNVYRATFMDKIMRLNVGTFAGGAIALGTAAFLKYMNVSWMSVGLMVPMMYFSIYAIMEMVFFVFIMTIIVPLFMLFVTLTLAKEIAKVLGTEIDLSALEKII